ncbi:MAG TPA: tetratricopeptide repeat protein [Clostridia bacterium]|nr:tetratricopeptide repeat protein [Clostridia bacterium]
MATKYFRYSVLLLAVALLAGIAVAQVSPHGAQTIVVLPFENGSRAPGLQWISEAFPEVLGAKLASPMLYVISREDRIYAFDRLGIPATVHPSRATLYRIAEQMDADYIVLGEYNFDGRTFSAQAQVLDMKRLRLSDATRASGPLPTLLDVQRTIAWQLLKTIYPETLLARDEFLRNDPPTRLDAFENYIRGVLAGTRQEKTRHFREAVRLNPQYTSAILQLGKTYYAGREYESAASWLSKVPKNHPASSEANFLLGLTNYYQGQFEKAEAAFRVTERNVPLTEVYNNIGVVLSRRGRRTAIEYFQRAVQADPNDIDYRFNLGAALYKNGDIAGATRQLREAVARRPADAEAKQLLDSLVSGSAANLAKPETPGTTPAVSASSPAKVPMERIKRNYDETSYRQLALEVQNAMEQALEKTDPRTHAAAHVERGRELLNRGFTMDAEREFREAIMRDPVNAGAHAGMARVAEVNGNVAVARSEADAALRLQPIADAYVVLGNLDLKDNNVDSASENADRALRLEPANPAAVALRRSITTRRAGVPEPAQR